MVARAELSTATPMVAFARHLVNEGFRNRRTRPLYLIQVARDAAQRAFRELAFFLCVRRGGGRLCGKGERRHEAERHDGCHGDGDGAFHRKYLQGGVGVQAQTAALAEGSEQNSRML